MTIHDHKATKHTENIANMRFLVVFLPTYIFLLFVILISRKEEERNDSFDICPNTHETKFNN